MRRHALPPLLPTTEKTQGYMGFLNFVGLKCLVNNIKTAVQGGTWLNVKNGVDSDGKAVTGSIVEGNLTDNVASGDYAHAEGNETTASGAASHAEGWNNEASVDNAHAEGNSTIASGNSSHSEGGATKASGEVSHAEGYETKATAYASHAEGKETIASGENSHAEGYGTQANGPCSHAEGQDTYAHGSCSHAEGINTNVVVDGGHAEGMFNYPVGSEGYQYIHSVGVGTNNGNRKNAVAVARLQGAPKDGYIYLLGIGGYEGQAMYDAKSLQEVISDLQSASGGKTTFFDADVLLTISSSSGTYYLSPDAYGGRLTTIILTKSSTEYVYLDKWMSENSGKFQKGDIVRFVDIAVTQDNHQIRGYGYTSNSTYYFYKNVSTAMSQILFVNNGYKYNCHEFVYLDGRWIYFGTARIMQP